MKNKIKIITLSLLATTSLLANERLSDVFQKGDSVEIDNCDKYQWCQIKGTDFYVKGYKFTDNKNGTFTMGADGNTYLYVKNSALESAQMKNFKKKEEFDTLSQQNFSELNKKYGYSRVSQTNLDTQKVFESVLKNEVEAEPEPKLEPKAEPAPKPEVKPQLKAKPKPEVKPEPIVEEETFDGKRWFTYGRLGYGSFGSNHPNSTDMLLEIGGGYHINNDYFTTLSYMENIEDDSEPMKGVEFSNIQLSLNKKFEGKYNPYAGVVLGYNSARYYLDMNDNTKIAEQSASTFSYGLQGGFGFPVLKNLNMDVNARYLLTDLKTQDLNVDNILGLFLSIRYDIK